MKIRNGFVSNSSSSSFVIVMTPEQETEWKKGLNFYEMQILTDDYSNLDRNEKTFNKQPIIMYSGASGDYAFYEEITLKSAPEDDNLSREEIEEKYDTEYYAGEFWYSAVDKLPKGAVYKSIYN